MARQLTVSLSVPLRSHGGAVIHSVVIREPNVFEVLEIGDPFTIGFSKDGGQIVAENPEAITAYIRRCIVEPKDMGLLEQGGVELARGLKQSLLSFFLPDATEGGASQTLPMTSPSAEAGTEA